MKKKNIEKMLNEAVLKGPDACPFQQYEIIKFNWDDMPKEYHKVFPKEFKKHMLFLGEIPNMPGHCVIVSTTGKTFWGYHTDEFMKVPEDEL